MILTVLIGNTHTRFVLFRGRRIVRRYTINTSRLESLPSWVERTKGLSGAVMASVVPKQTLTVYRLLSRETKTLLVSSRSSVPLKLNYHRQKLGVDRLCGAVGGYFCYIHCKEEKERMDLLIVDFGTAVSFNYVSANGEFYGGPIVPGVQIMLESLAQGTGQLPRVTFQVERQTVHRATVPAIRAGVYNLLFGGVRYIIQQLRSEIGEDRRVRVIGTGGGARFFRSQGLFDIIDQDLTSRGLVEIYYFNRRSNG